MTYSVEFIVSTGQFEHVKLTIEGQEFSDLFFGHDQDMEFLLGDYHASLKAAVLAGRDSAIKVASEMVKFDDQPDMPPIDPGRLITQELDAKVVETTEHVQAKPWERPVEQVPTKPWDVVASQQDKPVMKGLEDF